MSIPDSLENILKINVIEHSSDLDNIYQEWLNFYQTNVNSTPFQSPDWITVWCRYFISGKIHFIKITKSNDLICIIPLYIYTGSGRRELKFIGSGNTDYTFPLIKKGCETEIFNFLFEYIASIKDNLDEVYLQNIPLTNIQNIFTYKFLKEKDPYPVLYLPQDFNTYINSISSKFVGNINRSIRQLENSGELKFQTASENELDEYLDQLFDLHEKSWNERDAAGVLKDDKTRNFHKTAVKKLYRNNSVRLFRLTLGNKPLALLYMLVKNDIYYYYISGFSPEYKKFSPGSLILYKIVEEAFRSGIKKIDFLKGGEAYKYKWGAVNSFVYTLFINRQELISF